MPDTPQLRVTETEDELVSKAQTAVSQCNWTVGECAAKWTRKYARGRTDADFAALVGLSADQVFQRRRVFETFGEIHETWPTLKWSHFYVALNWDDAAECLEWAAENEAAVAEMRAWRRALRGEDLSEPPPDELAGDPSIRFVPTQPVPVRDPGAQSGGEAERRRTREGESESRSEPDTAGNQQTAAYAPYRQGAGSPPPNDEPEADSGHVAVAARPKPSAEQLIVRLTTTLERVNRALTPEIVAELDSLPRKTRERFKKAVGELTSKVLD